jgi:hypothetical protein
VSDRLRRPWLRWTLLLLPPLAGVVLVVVASREHWDALLLKGNHEAIAVPLVGAALGFWALAAWRGRGRGHADATAPAAVAAAVLVFVLLCREIHFAGSDLLVTFVLLGGGWWAWRRLPLLRRLLRERVEFQVLVAALWSYVVAEAVAQRAFRGVPGERELHIPIEELDETVGHLLLLAAAAIAAWQVCGRRGAERGAAEGSKSGAVTVRERR